MKKIKLTGRLSLTKSTISKLNDMENVKGGYGITDGSKIVCVQPTINNCPVPTTNNCITTGNGGGFQPSIDSCGPTAPTWGQC